MSYLKPRAWASRLRATPQAVGSWYTASVRARLVLQFMVAFVPFWIACFYVLDYDFGWHLQAGNYIRAHGVPAHDIFSYTASSYRWVDHEWGSDVLLSLGYSLGGFLLVATAAALLWTAAVLVAAGRGARLLPLALAVLALLPLVVVRPTVFTALFFALLLAWLRRPRLSRWYWLLPLLFLVWANLHGGFIAGLGLIAYFAVFRRSWRLAVIGLACLAVTVCNPYGVRLYGEVFRTIFDNRLHDWVAEWYSFYITKPALLFVDFWLAGFWLYDKRRLRNWFGLSPLLLLATMSASRNILLFVIAGLHELPRYVQTTLDRIPRHLDWRRRLVLWLLAAGVAYLAGVGVNAARLELHVNREAAMPAAAVAYLRQFPCPGHMYNNYNYGGYLIWKLPQSKVYIDGRMPTWEPYMSRYEKIVADPASIYKAEFARYNIQCALLMDGQDKKLAHLLAADGWKTVSDNSGARLLYSPRAAAQRH